MDSTRRSLLCLAGAATLLPRAARAGTNKRKRILWYGFDPKNRERIRGLFAARGLIDGRNCIIHFTQLPEDRRDMPAHLERLVASRPDVLVVWEHAPLLLREVRDLPIVFINTPTDPARLGLVESLRRPGGNMTGSTLADEEMTLFMWQMLKEVAPGMKRGAFLLDDGAIREMERTSDRRAWQASYDNHMEARRLIESQLGIHTVEVRMQRDASVEDINSLVRKSGAQAIQVVIIPATDAVIGAIKAMRLPAVGISFRDVRRGLLMGVSWDYREGVSYAVEAVERIILKGESPATIPVYRVREWVLAINRTTARTMGIDIPPSLVMRAKEIFE